jgi:hypothetical protein
VVTELEFAAFRGLRGRRHAAVRQPLRHACLC